VHRSPFLRHLLKVRFSHKIGFAWLFLFRFFAILFLSIVKTHLASTKLIALKLELIVVLCCVGLLFVGSQEPKAEGMRACFGAMMIIRLLIIKLTTECAIVPTE
jgi:hypothetical protein